MLRGYAGDECLGAVTTRHAEQVGAVSDGLSGQGRDVDLDRPVEQRHLRA